jgi:hypothetical protein
MFFRPAVFDSDILTFYVAGFIQALAECGCEGDVAMARPQIEIADYRHRRLLRARRQRPCSRPAPEPRDEVAPSHVLPSSRGPHATTTLKKED